MIAQEAKGTMTQAAAALAALKSQHVVVDDNGMFNSYDQLTVCHGCGTIHAIRSAFISSPMAMGFRFADNSMLTIPCGGCPACMADKDKKPIREAWEKGISYATSRRAHELVGAPVPEPPKPCRICAGTSGLLDESGAHCLCVARARLGVPTPCLDAR